jgi:ketopantoate reductase
VAVWRSGPVALQNGVEAPTQLESQSGAVVRLGREKGVATPVHDSIYRSLIALELQVRAVRAR